MIDLHCHLLPNIDDGPRDVAASLEMARIAVADGITCTVCTPHIYPGLYNNTAAGIAMAVQTLREQLLGAAIPLDITFGADIQLVPHLLQGLQTLQMPTLHGSRYFLFEPPHHVAPPRFLDTLFSLLTKGYVPVITHPERLTWIEDGYDLIVNAVRAGAWIQVTGGALTGRFGNGPRYWSERLLGEGIVHVLATDAHDPKFRPPLLAEAKHRVTALVGKDEAEQLVSTRPSAILQDLEPSKIYSSLSYPTPLTDDYGKPKPSGWVSKWFGAKYSR